jgi:hypothetical protein
MQPKPRSTDPDLAVPLGRLLAWPRAITRDHSGGDLDSGAADEAFAAFIERRWQATEVARHRFTDSYF